MHTFHQIVGLNLKSTGAQPDDTYLVALSGGGDSTALLLSLVEVVGKNNVAAAHLDHGVRPGSKRDRELVEDLCRGLGVHCLSEELTMDEVARERKRSGSLEGALRTLRYRFLDRAAGKTAADWIATGHTVDDLAETVLFRVARSMDWRSLAGIPARRGAIIRPILGLTGEKAREYCREMGVGFLEDPTNLEGPFARNLIRHRLLPGLIRSFRPDIVALLARFSSAVDSLARYEDRLVGHVLETGTVDGGTVMDLQRFQELPLSLAHGAIIHFLRCSGSTRVSMSLLSDIERFLRTGGTGRLDLPGGRVLMKGYGRARVRVRDNQRPPKIPDEPVVLKVPGRTDLFTAGLAISANTGHFRSNMALGRAREALLSAESVALPLRVRRRLPGDLFTPLGMRRAKKLKDFLIDRKIPRVERDAIPIVIDAAGRIIWVAGVEISDHAALKKQEGERVLLLRMSYYSHNLVVRNCKM